MEKELISLQVYRAHVDKTVKFNALSMIAARTAVKYWDDKGLLLILYHRYISAN